MIAARDGEGDVERCLDALAAQVDDDVEVLVMARPGSDALVPELWADGVDRARGELIGLLATTATPAADWVACTRSLHGDGSPAAVGGAIDPAERLRVVDWAVYFCRYAPYLRPVIEQGGLELAADNASYRGDVVRTYRELYRDGFWEPRVHHAMRRDGHRLLLSSARVVRFAGGTSAASFCRQRYRHGRVHGRDSARGTTRAAIALRAATAPLVPPLLAVRAGRTVFGKGRHRARFVVASPLVLLFFGCWALGELRGRLDAVLTRGLA